MRPCFFPPQSQVLRSHQAIHTILMSVRAVPSTQLAVNTVMATAVSVILVTMVMDVLAFVQVSLGLRGKLGNGERRGMANTLFPAKVEKRAQ